MNDLTNIEKDQLKKNESIIERGQKTFFEVGMALKDIRDGRLYRQEYKTFENYCRERWGWYRDYTDRLIQSASVIKNLTPIGVKPSTESQARPLVQLSPEEQKEVWEKAVETAPEGKITAAHVEETVKGFKEEKRQEEKIKPKTISQFNKTNDNIEWALWTWNPVTGCKHNCDYCYARDIANRFTGHFNPEFHEDRLGAPGNTNPDLSISGGKNVFVCSMADLFGAWIPNEWIFKVIEQVKNNPQWTFLFLTKNPRRYKSIQFPDNAWIGTTIDKQSKVNDAEKFMDEADATIKFISVEPMLEPIILNDPKIFDWVIIGAKSKTSGSEEFQPDFRWVLNLTNQCMEEKCKVYWKPNLKCRPMEYPA